MCAQADIRKSAFVKVGIGAEKQSRNVISEKEKRITAYHEAGHAILFHVLPDVGRSIQCISHIPTGPRRGRLHHAALPEKDEMFQTRGKDAAGHRPYASGGRVAEELIFDDITTGASQDIKQATPSRPRHGHQVRHVRRASVWSAYDSDSDEVFLGRDCGHTKGYGENVASKPSTRRSSQMIVDECHDQAKADHPGPSATSCTQRAKRCCWRRKRSAPGLSSRPLFEQEAQMTGPAPAVSGES